MRPRHFPGENLVYKGPTSDIGDLPCERVNPGVIRSVWELEPWERIAIGEGADIELFIHGEPIPPVALIVSNVPKEVSVPAEEGG